MIIKKKHCTKNEVPENLVTFNEEILNEKLHVLYNETC